MHSHSEDYPQLQPLWIEDTFPGIVNGEALCFKWPIRVHLVPAGWGAMTVSFSLEEGFGGAAKHQISASKWSFSSCPWLCLTTTRIVARMWEHPENLWARDRFSGISIFSWDRLEEVALACLWLVCFRSSVCCLPNRHIPSCHHLWTLVWPKISHRDKKAKQSG